MIDFVCTTIDWDKCQGLVPVIVQDHHSLRVLMLGYCNQEALSKTLETGLVTFYSRSKQRLWQKGETSGHILELISIRLDCDQDTLLMSVVPHGPCCHNGTTTCFGENQTVSLSDLSDLAQCIHQRRLHPLTNSYTNTLLNEGIARIAQKVGEEGVETALAAATNSSKVAEEAADLIYHLLVLLEASSLTLYDVLNVLNIRSKK